jgi:hypothetical protein
LTRNIESGKNSGASTTCAFNNFAQFAFFSFCFQIIHKLLVFVLGPPPDGGAANLSMPFLIRVEEEQTWKP